MFLGVVETEYKMKLENNTILIGKAVANEVYKVSAGSDFETPIILTAR